MHLNVRPNLITSMKSRERLSYPIVSSLAVWAGVIALFLSVPLKAWADDLLVAEGERVTLSQSAAYEKIDVQGTLTVCDGAVVTVPNLALGAASGVAQIVATGAGSKVGEAVSNMAQPPTALTLGVNGRAGQLVCQDGGAIGVSKLTIAADARTNETGFVDWGRIAGGRLALREAQNASSVTGRIVCAGGTLASAQAWYPAMFQKGAFRLEVEEGATFQLSFQHVGGQTFNAKEATVLLDGDGHFSFAGSRDNDAYKIDFNKGVTFNPSGKLRLASCRYFFHDGVTFGPNLQGIELADGSLTVDAGVVVRTPSFVLGEDAVLDGQGTLQLVVAESDRTVFRPSIAEGATLVVEKLGPGALGIEEAGSIPSFVLTEGSVCFSADVTVGSLTLASGATCVVDGATVTATELNDHGARVELVNGGRIVRVADVDADELAECRDYEASRGGLMKTGLGTLRLYDPALTGTVHVAAGTLAFSRKGLSDRYVRLTFKELLPFWYGGNYKPVGLLCGKVALYDANGARCSFKEDLPVRFGRAAVDLQEGEVTAPEGTTYWAENNNFNYFFATYTGYAVRFTRCAVTNTLDAGCWQSVTKRLRPDVPEVDGVNFCGGWDYGNPTTWTVETSATGEDGSWRIVLDKRGARHPNQGQNNTGWLNGVEAAPAYLFSYSEAGVRGLADTLAAQVDAGGTLDFSAKTGGQVLDRLVYDPSRGGGTISNVAFAANGVLEIVSETGKVSDCGDELPWSFVSVGDGANVKTWKVLFNGVAVRRRLDWADGKLRLLRDGCVVVIR